MAEWIMTVSRNGQVSIPAEVRARWHARKVVVEDHGDRITVHPVEEDALDELMGKYARPGQPTTDEIRRQEREDEALWEERRYGARP